MIAQIALLALLLAFVLSFRGFAASSASKFVEIFVASGDVKRPVAKARPGPSAGELAPPIEPGRSLGETIERRRAAPSAP